jgi:hypothetical protein
MNKEFEELLSALVTKIDSGNESVLRELEIFEKQNELLSKQTNAIESQSHHHSQIATSTAQLKVATSRLHWTTVSLVVATVGLAILTFYNAWVVKTDGESKIEYEKAVRTYQIYEEFVKLYNPTLMRSYMHPQISKYGDTAIAYVESYFRLFSKIDEYEKFSMLNDRILTDVFKGHFKDVFKNYKKEVDGVIVFFRKSRYTSLVHQSSIPNSEASKIADSVFIGFYNTAKLVGVDWKSPQVDYINLGL